MRKPRRIKWTKQKGGVMRSAGGTYEIHQVAPPLRTARQPRTAKNSRNWYRLFKVIDYEPGLLLVGEFRTYTEATSKANEHDTHTA